jgi:ParB-like chromosome segregation protein Spo0J
MTSSSALPSLTVEDVAIDRLRPDPANPRRIGEDELDALERSLRQFGFVQPVLARREDQTVIGGHQRLVAARRLGLASVPVTWLDISVEQARLLGLALNKISGSWDEALLARLLADLQATPDLDLTLSGFGEDEVKELLRSLETRETCERPEAVDLEEAFEEARRAPRAKPRRRPPGCHDAADARSWGAGDPAPAVTPVRSPACSADTPSASVLSCTEARDGTGHDRWSEGPR